ncbi:MAG TPA: hypothetical protein VH330_01670 [Candidatus Udaeobacter sp.]
MADLNELTSQMPTTEESDYISAVFPNFLEPIAVLCDAMLSLPGGDPNEVQTSVIKNGYAMSIIALAAFLLEGACGRARYCAGLDEEAKRWSAAATLREFKENDLAEKIEEIFVVRDAIARAHLWKGKTAWTENDLRFTQLPVQLPGYGDEKFKRLVDLDSRITRKLKLDVFPTRIHRGTAITVLKECVAALESLELKHEKFFLPLRFRTVRLRGGEFHQFYRWVRALNT